MSLRIGRAAAATALIALFAGQAVAGQVVKSRLDPSNVGYTGLDLNGDEYPDGVMVNIVTYEKTFLIGGPRDSMRRVRLSSLGEQERAEFPDMFTEVDLNGDHVSDLIAVNRERLNQFADNEQTFCRILEYSLYFGGEGGVFRTVRFLSLTEEERAIIIRAAKATLLDRRPQ